MSIFTVHSPAHTPSFGSPRFFSLMISTNMFLQRLMKDIRYWVSKVLTPEQAEVQKMPEPKHSVTERLRSIEQQKRNQSETRLTQQKKQDQEH